MLHDRIAGRRKIGQAKGLPALPGPIGIARLSLTKPTMQPSVGLESKSDGALLYDALEVLGGAELFSLEVANKLDCPLYVGSCSPLVAKVVSAERNKVYVLGPNLPKVIKTVIGLIIFFVNRKKFNSKRWLIFSGTNTLAASWFSSTTKKILYCHTPPRFAFDLRGYYLNRMPIGLKALFSIFSRAVAKYYSLSLKNIDVVIANSKNTADRLLLHCNLAAEVLYPPVATANYRWSYPEPFFLSMARCEDYKRVDLIIRAFIGMPDKKLVVISGGASLKQLTAMAAGHSNIDVRGWVSEAEKCDLLSRCTATIYVPIDEDFGLSPVESMAAGKPVIGVAEGGLKETVIDGITGVLIDSSELSEATLRASVGVFTQEFAAHFRWACEKQACAFDSQRFYSRMREVVAI